MLHNLRNISDPLFNSVLSLFFTFIFGNMSVIRLQFHSLKCTPKSDDYMSLSVDLLKLGHSYWSQKLIFIYHLVKYCLHICSSIKTYFHFRNDWLEKIWSNGIQKMIVFQYLRLMKLHHEISRRHTYDRLSDTVTFLPPSVLVKCVSVFSSLQGDLAAVLSVSKGSNDVSHRMAPLDLSSSFSFCQRWLQQWNFQLYLRINHQKFFTDQIETIHFIV